MSSDDLGLFSFEILALVGPGGASAHDLRRLAQEVRMVAWAGESQYYVEPKRLARLGYLEARKAPGRTRERTVYTLTEKGREAIRAYARTPARFTPFKSDALLRLLLADLGGEGATRTSLAALRTELTELEAQLDAAAAGAEALPHRARYLRLAQDFLRRLIELHRELIDEVEQELAPE
jgi:PadR family transcriptional regulator, regulatory protein AphA